MRKRLFAFLLTLVLLFSVLPGTVFAAEPAAPAEVSGGGILDAARAKMARLGGLTRTETYEISEKTLKAVTSKIVAGLKNWSAEIDVSGYELGLQEGYDLYNEVLDAHYEFFYVKNCNLIYSAGGLIIKPIYDTAYTSSDVTAFNNICSAIVAGIPQGTNVEKLLYLHDYLITHCEYDQTYSKTNAYNALVEGSAVCDGYSKAYKVLCSLAGLTCEYVASDNIDHSWNMVQVGNGDTAWYYVDCTWDDPINGCESCCEHQNFLLSKAACKAEHDSEDWINGRKENVYNTATSTTYDSYWWKDLNRSVQWVGTKMCYAKSTDWSHVYFRSSGASSETAVTIQGGGNKWNVWGNSSRSWAESFITVASDGGAFYYSTPTQIWKLTTGGTMTLAYTLTAAEQKQGYIYGIQCSANGLTYYIGQDPLQPSVASDTLSIPPSITTQPKTQTVTEGTKVTFKVAATGATTYQWQYKTSGGTWTNCKSTGYNTATFSFKATASLNGRQYRCKVSNAAGSVTSNAATLTVTSTSAKPTITTQPANQSVTAGATATFSVAASGTGLSYQWQYKTSGGTWTNCKSTGYNTATFSFKATASLNGRQYRCEVSNTAGSVYSNAATLTVTSTSTKPTITTQPGNATVALGKSTTFKVVATGATSYQWEYSKNNGKSWTTWSGKTSASLKVTASATNNGCLYRCVVTNSVGSVTSNAAQLTVSGVKPTILTQPASKSVTAGTTVSLKVVAAGTGLTYQWQYSTNGTTWTNCKSTGYNTATFSFKATATLNGRQYRCVVSNASGDTNSSAATLTVK